MKLVEFDSMCIYCGKSHSEFWCKWKARIYCFFHTHNWECLPVGDPKDSSYWECLRCHKKEFTE